MNPGDGPVPAACLANLGPRGTRIRRLVGIAGFVAGTTFLLYLLFTDSLPHWRALVFAPFYGGALGWFQAQDRTCTALSARGLRDPDAPPVPAAVDRAELDRAIARRARLIQFKSIGLAAVLTALAYALPAGR